MIQDQTLEKELLISTEDIHLITGLDMEAAKKEHQYIRALIGNQSEDLLLSQYCNHCDLDIKEVTDFLYPIPTSINL